MTGDHTRRRSPQHQRQRLFLRCDRKSQVGKLDKAWDAAVRRGWLVGDMKRDWKKVFPFE